MGKTRYYLAALALFAFAGWTCRVDVAHARSLEIRTGSQFAPNAAPVSVKMKGDVQVTGTGYKRTNNSCEISNACLRTKDGVLEAKTDSLVFEKARTSKRELSRMNLVGKVSTVVVQSKGEPEIKVSAAKGYIDWVNQVVELQGDVSVTVLRADQSGKLVPTTMTGDSVRILLAQKLNAGQERVLITNSASKSVSGETTNTP